MRLDWLEMRLISFTWCTSLICLERASTAFCLCSAASVKVKRDEIWILNFYWLASPEALVACLNEKVWQEEAGQKRARGFEWGCNLRQKNLHSWECSRPCRRGICIRPSKPQRLAGHCAWRSNRCHCCRVFWCARYGPLWRTGGLPCSHHTATPTQQKERVQINSCTAPNVEANQTTGIEV